MTTETILPGLKPCPMCGFSTGYCNRRSDAYVIDCSSCGSWVPFERAAGRSAQDAAKHWNDLPRHTDEDIEAKDAEIEALKAKNAALHADVAKIRDEWQEMVDRSQKRHAELHAELKAERETSAHLRAEIETLTTNHKLTVVQGESWKREAEGLERELEQVEKVRDALLVAIGELAKK